MIIYYKLLMQLKLKKNYNNNIDKHKLKTQKCNSKTFNI